MSVRPPYDPAVEAALGSRDEPSLTREGIGARRALPRLVTAASLVEAFGVRHQEFTIPGYRGDEIVMAVFTPPGYTPGGPVVYNIHGGGMVMGDRFSGVEVALPWAVTHGTLVASVEYRLAPEHPDPYPVEDCYAGLAWLATHAGEIGGDPDRLVLLGISAGGGLAAGVTLLARDRGGPRAAGQMLICPMLDDRDCSVSTRQFDGVGLWDRASNLTAWTALLGERRGGPDVSVYAAPARAADLRALPPAFLEVGSAEVFRDETVAYAQRLWHCGGEAELHVWPGGTHGFFNVAPAADISRGAAATREAWLARLLG
jgi:acetyl esterase/lipase